MDSIFMEAVVNSKLIEKLNALTPTFTDAELDNYKLLLGMAAGGIAPDGDIPETGHQAEAFKTILNCLARIQPSGIVWRGRPDFMTDDLLIQLQQESIQRRTTAIAHDQHFLGCGGTVANRLAESKLLLDLVTKEAATPMAPTGVASYLYYDREGCGLPPHVDTQTFTMNAILMLKHEYRNDSPAHLVVYPVNEPPQKILLQPGELILLFAGGTIHAREKMKAGEIVNILTFGFLPVR
jgi:hypothetical protein